MATPANPAVNLNLVLDQVAKDKGIERAVLIATLEDAMKTVECERKLTRGFQTGITRADVNDESLLPRAPQFRQPCLDAIHAGGSVPLPPAGGKRKFSCSGDERIATTTGGIISSTPAESARTLSH